jgi:hypothetical protein
VAVLALLLAQRLARAPRAAAAAQP